jgi:RNA polymerase sigma-70 factor, ECF subfamily
MPTATRRNTDWPSVVQQIAKGNGAAVEELYEALLPVRLLLARQLGTDNAQDIYHSILIDLVRAIREDRVREPWAIPLYIRTMARRSAAARIGELMAERRAVTADKAVLQTSSAHSPEALAMQSERFAIARRILAALPTRHQEVLRRFYVDEESPETIMRVMKLTETQFRLVKSRAKARYAELVQHALRRQGNRPDHHAVSHEPRTLVSSEPGGCA